MKRKLKKIICIFVSVLLCLTSVVVVTADSDIAYGDLNGSGGIGAEDALLILQHSVGKISFNNTQKLCADVSGDGEINANDALLVLQYTVLKITKFPVENNVHTHSYVKKVYAPTCLEMGCTMFVCSCGDSYISELTDTLSHDFSNGICTMCGSTIKEYSCDYLKQWLKINGTYEDEEFEYIFERESDYSNVYGLSYDAEIDDLYVWHYQALSYGVSSYTAISLDDYLYYFSFYGDKIYGYIDAKTYSENSSLTYLSCECKTYTAGQMLSLAETSVSLSLESLRYCLLINEIPISLADLGYLIY